MFIHPGCITSQTQLYRVTMEPQQGRVAPSPPSSRPMPRDHPLRYLLPLPLQPTHSYSKAAIQALQQNILIILYQKTFLSKYPSALDDLPWLFLIFLIFCLLIFFSFWFCFCLGFFDPIEKHSLSLSHSHNITIG